MIKKPNGEEFTGRSSEMKESCWLASEDLIGIGDVRVTIERCSKYRDVEFDKGRKEPSVYALKFAGKQKELVLNSTNRKALVSKFGTNVKEWVDKEVILYVDHNVKFQGKKVSGIRIK